MDSERWQQIQELLQSALSLNQNERAGFLDKACSGDESLRAELEAMLELEKQAEDFLETPAFNILHSKTEEPKEPLSDKYEGTLFKDRYKIEVELGRGGIGVVYKACDKTLHDRPVVIKILLDRSDQNEWLKKKFRHESEALSRIHHPGVVEVYDQGEIGSGKPYFVMEFIEGETLRNYIKPEGMDFDYAAQILKQLGEALEAAHAEGVYHRDLKPENIMLQKLSGGMEQVKLIDFGIAKVNNPRSASHSTVALTVGTIPYMAPEQIERNESSVSSDIYSLAVISYEMLTGACPFNPDSRFQFVAMNQVLTMQQEGKYIKPIERRLDLPEAAQNTIVRALSYDIKNRQKSANEFTKELVNALTSKGSIRSDSSQKREVISEESTVVVGDKNQLAKARTAKKSFLLPAITVISMLLFLGIGGALFVPKYFRRESPSKSESGVEPAEEVAKRILIYWMMVQKDPKRFPDSKPFRLPGEYNFEKGYQVRLNLSSPESGYLYILNEGPSTDNGLPQYNVIFPKPTMNGGSALIAANEQIQIPDQSWLVFDAEEGTEKFWLIWTAKSIPELEAVKSVVNPQDKGVISKPDQIKSVQDYISRYTASKPQIERDEDKKLTIVKTGDEVLVNLLRVEHH
jgi:serine/threonine protein kinase